jgi:hypothetical protein
LIKAILGPENSQDELCKYNRPVSDRHGALAPRDTMRPDGYRATAAEPDRFRFDCLRDPLVRRLPAQPVHYSLVAAFLQRL